MEQKSQSLDRLRIDRSAPGARGGGGGGWGGWVVGLLLLAAAFAGWWWTRQVPLEVRIAMVREAGPEAAGSAPRTVLNGSGYVTPRRVATISSKITGKVVEVMVEEGNLVSSNQVLARLDDSNLLASRKLSDAQLASARVAIKETQAQITDSRSRFERTRGLVAEKIASPSDLDRDEAAHKALEARLERLIADVAVAERSLQIWDQQLEDCIIRAPFAGVVTAKNAQPGETISPMSAGGFTRTGICTLVDMDSLEIEVDVNESYIGRVSSGQGVEATLDAYSDWKIPARVIAIIPTADRQKATVKVRVGFEKLDPRILPQMGVKVAFQGAGEIPGAGGAVASIRRLAPKGAIQDRDGRQWAWVVKEGRVERRAISAREAGAGEFQVTAGLNTGDRLVMDPPEGLKDGARVRTR